MVAVHATGTVKETGKKFWSTKDPGAESFAFQAGVGGVIVGWDQGCLGMKIGETRLLDIPSEEAYGEGGFDAWGVPNCWCAQPAPKVSADATISVHSAAHTEHECSPRDGSCSRVLVTRCAELQLRADLLFEIELLGIQGKDEL